MKRQREEQDYDVMMGCKTVGKVFFGFHAEE
jgi:hypothetical protein